MKRRLLCILLMLCIATLSACAGSGETGESASDTPTAGSGNDVSNIESPEGSMEQQKQTGSEIINEEEPASSSAPEPATIIDWTDISYTYTDVDGYIYEIAYKLSPWILLSNTDAVNAAWKEISESNMLPNFKDWGLQQESTGNYFRQGVPHGGSTNYFSHHMTDMYYCIGTVQITNLTEEWRISASSPRSLYFNLMWASAFDKLDYAGVYSIGRVFYSNGTEDESDGLWHSASLNSDQWGPVSFVIMAPENFSPNYPEGEYFQYMLDGFFYYTENSETKEVRVGVIDGDGSYTPPISVKADS